jgi:mannose-6-phosphate isomerase
MIAQPLRFNPVLKRLRWGGRRLGTVLGKTLGAEDDYAESWELSDHGDDQSVCSRGEFAGSTLGRLVQEHPSALLGRHDHITRFPLLIKFLDACDRLSLQVHPKDAQAAEFRPGESGKTEAWVILEASPSARIFAGLQSGVSHDDLRLALEQGQIEACLHSFQAKTGQCVFVPAGTVHAIDAGVLLAEVQQSSDITFRLHDWGRLGIDRKPRPLHIGEALECIDFDRGPISPVLPQPAPLPTHVAEELVSCPYFVMRRHATAAAFDVVPDKRFRIVMLLSGHGELESSLGAEPIRTGDTVLIPADCPPVRVTPHGDIGLLEVHLP